MAAFTVTELKADRMRFWIGIVLTIAIVQFVNFASRDSYGYGGERNPAREAVAVLGYLAIGAQCAIFSRAIGQAVWKTVLAGVLGIFALVYLVPMIWLSVDCSRRLRELEAGAGSTTYHA
jgi:hypothetical protein